MNSETKRKLKNINLSVASKYHKELVDTIDPFEEEKVNLEHSARRNPSYKAREMSKKLLVDERGFFDKSRQTVNPEVAKKIEKEVEYKIKKAIERGDIPPADMNDPWIKKQLHLSRKTS